MLARTRGAVKAKVVPARVHAGKTGPRTVRRLATGHVETRGWITALERQAPAWPLPAGRETMFSATVHRRRARQGHGCAFSGHAQDHRVMV